MAYDESYPDRFEVSFDVRFRGRVKLVFAKNASAFHGYDCWMEGRSGKPVSGRAVTFEEKALLEYIWNEGK